MALFEKVKLLNSECHQELFQFYEKGCVSIEVRNILAVHIETSLCGDNCPSVEQPGEVANFVESLLKNLEELITNGGDALPFFTKHKLHSALQQLKEEHAKDPFSIFLRMQECLQFEQELVNRGESGLDNAQDVIMDNLGFMRRRGELTNSLLKGMLDEQARFENIVEEKRVLDGHMENVKLAPQNDQTKAFEANLDVQIKQKEMLIQATLQKMMSLWKEFWENMESNVKNITQLQNQVFQDKLFQWRFEQQKTANGFKAVNPTSLDKVQRYLEILAELIWQHRQQVYEAGLLKSKMVIGDSVQNYDPSLFFDDLSSLLITLLNESFVIEDQPQQIMKKGNKFVNTPKVSLLIGNLNIQMSKPQVSTSIIREKQARDMSSKEHLEEAMPITNRTSMLEFNPSTRRLTGKFSSLQLKEIKRADRRGSGGTNSESVMEEKLCMLFESMLTVGEMRIRVRALSLPVVVVSHGSQEAMGDAVIMWDNAFGVMGRQPFVVPARVPWADVAQIMSAKFFTVTGRALSESHLRCLKQKAFRSNSQQEFITWTDFCKDNLPVYGFPFWQWVHAGLKVIRDTYLKELWKDGHIEGFIERDMAASMLNFREPGTFMLRFSDSKPGAISISVVDDDRNVICIAPIEENDSKQKKLATAIRDLEKLKTLFPGIPKDTVFGKYYPAPEPSASALPYVPLKHTIPSTSQGNNSSTPSPASPPVLVTPPVDVNRQDFFEPMMDYRYGGMSPGHASSVHALSNPNSPMMNNVQGMSPSYTQHSPYDASIPPFLDQALMRLSPADEGRMAEDIDDLLNDGQMSLNLDDHDDLLVVPTSVAEISQNNNGNHVPMQTTTSGIQGIWTNPVML